MPIDPTQSVIYNGFDFNDVRQDPILSGITGCSLQTINETGVEVVGYTEKRALDQGRDASDVYFGQRQIALSGTLYGSSRADLFDHYRAMEHAVNPTLAFLSDPYRKGFLPLRFSEPTEFTEEWVGGEIPLQYHARAVTAPLVTIRKEASGTNPEDPIAVPFDITFAAIDPRRYAQERVTAFLGSSADLVMHNRGTLPVALSIMVIADAATFARRFHIVGGGTDLTVTVPSTPDAVAVRIDAEKRQVTLQAGDGEEIMAMDLIDPNVEWPLASSGDNAISWDFTRATTGAAVALRTQSVIWFREAYG